MRILFTSLVNPGHLRPMVPLAWALRSAGHEIVVASAPNMTGAALAVGLHAFGYGEDINPVASMRRRLAAGAQSQVEQFDGRPSTQRSEQTGRRIAQLSARTIDELLTFARRWRPDAVVHEPMDITGRLVAAALGVPSALHRWGVDTLEPYAAAAAAALPQTCCRLGISPADLEPSVVIDPCPPSLQRTDVRPGWPIRYVPDNGAAAVPPWTLERPHRRRVGVTFGNLSLGIGASPALRATFAALARLDVEVVAAVPHEHRELVGATGRNVRIVESVPLGLFIDSCSAMIHHGGTGSSFTSLAAGVPQLVLAQSLDSFEYGDGLERLGAGHLLESADEQSDVDLIADLVRRLVEQPRYRRAAAALAAENAAAPTPLAVATRLVDTVTASPRRPVTRPALAG